MSKALLAHVIGLPFVGQDEPAAVAYLEAHKAASEAKP